MVERQEMLQRSFAQDWINGLRSPAPYVSWIVLVAALTFAAPFRDYIPFPFLSRFLFVAAAVALALIWGVTLQVFLQRRLPAVGRNMSLLVGALVSAPVLACPIRCMAFLAVPAEAMPVPSLVSYAAMILASGLIVAGIRLTFDTRRPSAAPDLRQEADIGRDASAAVDAPSLRLLQRLPPGDHGALQHLSVRDHYVIVRTERALYSLLMRFADAIAETDGSLGLRVHRSHWVALDAVQGARRDNGRWLLKLHDGTEVPVSRSYLPEVAAAGLVED